MPNSNNHIALLFKRRQELISLLHLMMSILVLSLGTIRHWNLFTLRSLATFGNEITTALFWLFLSIVGFKITRKTSISFLLLLCMTCFCMFTMAFTIVSVLTLSQTFAYLMRYANILDSILPGLLVVACFFEGIILCSQSLILSRFICLLPPTQQQNNVIVTHATHHHSNTMHEMSPTSHSHQPSDSLYFTLDTATDSSHPYLTSLYSQPPPPSYEEAMRMKLEVIPSNEIIEPPPPPPPPGAPHQSI